VEGSTEGAMDGAIEGVTKLGMGRGVDVGVQAAKSDRLNRVAAMVRFIGVSLQILQILRSYRSYDLTHVRSYNAYDLTPSVSAYKK
jgi:hypothetical protein